MSSVVKILYGVTDTARNIIRTHALCKSDGHLARIGDIVCDLCNNIADFDEYLGCRRRHATMQKLTVNAMHRFECVSQFVTLSSYTGNSYDCPLDGSVHTFASEANESAR